MASLNVLDLRDTYEVGGPGKTILETFRTIDAVRFRLHLGVFAVNGESTDSPFLRQAREYGIPVHIIRSAHPYDPRLVSTTAALTRSLGIDVVHAHEVKSDVITYLAAKLHRVKTVTTIHGWIANSAKQRALVSLDKRVARGFHRVLAVSTLIREQLVEAGVPARRIRVVHNAIVTERYRRLGRRGLLASLAGRALQAPVVVSIGRLSLEKGHADLVEAVALAASRGCPVSVAIAGEGPERLRLERQITDRGLADRVVLLGHIDRPERILEEADLMVLPSHTEGLPNVALEALAMEVPVLATRVGGTPEVVIDGETGVLVEARSPHALAAALVDFCGRREWWASTAVAGRQRVARQFDFSARTRTIESIYDEVAAESRL